MGCGGSKVDDLPLVTLCRERKELVRAAADHRYALAASHFSYFRSLKDVGDALRRFVDEEVVIGVAAAGSALDSPVFTLSSDELMVRKSKKKKKSKSDGDGKSKSSSSLSSISSSHLRSHNDQESPEGYRDRDRDHDHDHNHLHFASDSDAESNKSSSSSGSSSGHIHIASDSPEQEKEEPEPQPYSHWSVPSGMNSYAYYMKKSATVNPSFVYQDPGMSAGTSSSQWPDSSSYSNSGYPQYNGYFGVPMGSDYSPRDPYYYYQSNKPPSPPKPPPSPPPPLQNSAWDFLNPFGSAEDAYTYYPMMGRYGIGSTASSPDSVVVRQREGIPDLEDEAEQEPVKELRKDKQKMEENVRGDFGEGTSTAVPESHAYSEDHLGPREKEIKSSPDSTIVSENTGEVEEITRKKGVTFEVGAQSAQDGESSMPSSLTTLRTQGTRDMTQGTRDIREAVNEIRDEFAVASDNGKEVALMLEVGKMPYQSRSTVLREISSWIVNLIAPLALTSSHPPPRQSQLAAMRAMKRAKVQYGYSEDFIMRSCNLSTTLERLYAWEKKLYKEVKDEEKLRVIYEKKCKRLKVLDYRGAESYKIEATQASIRKLLTKINVAITTVDAIARKIHKLRDEELQPQIMKLIDGFIRMWKSMLRSHQKQFQAIIDSKSRMLRVNTGVQRDSSLKATVDLEWELMNWSAQFYDWITNQKAYIESLNGWLLRCLLQEQEETPDGPMPFSPSRAGAPLVFIVCNDWYNAMERLSEARVVETVNAFALTLHQLWERQSEEQRQRIKAEYISKDFEKRLRHLRKEEGRMHRDLDASSDKSGKSVVPTESGVSPLDDLKVDLDSMRKRMDEERTKYKETVKRVNETASNSLQAGLIPIFEALENFTSETLEAYERVRLQNGGGPS
ncbi:hypothetical protein Sjap_021578 [Stephania japonica]|uniref:Uncharacterized protein n=1 Tax=Stephania japonica TaxID=461633 RepID=A0AAP0EM81_9MAGN